MTIEEVKQFGHGVFRIFWKNDGGSSLAAIGSLHDGTPWFAPSNWTSEVAGGIASTDWRKVEYLQRLA